MNILIAGIGNVFLGDDAFGVMVAQELARLTWPAGVQVRDFGIRGIHLAYELERDLDAAIVVDAARRNGLAGTLYVIEPQVRKTDGGIETTAMSAHAMHPQRMLEWLLVNGHTCRNMVVVACEPESFGTEDDGPGRMGLSAPVAAAVPEAMKIVQELVTRFVEQEGVCHA